MLHMRTYLNLMKMKGKKTPPLIKKPATVQKQMPVTLNLISHFLLSS